MPDLPTVEETFIANIAPFVAAMEKMREELFATSAAVLQLQGYINDLHGKTVDIDLETSGAAAASGMAAMARGEADAAAAAQDASRQIIVLQKSTQDSAAAAVTAANSFRLWGTGIRLTGTALHWIAAGAAEFLAVAVPAAVALGAGLLVAAQGAQNVQRHFTALYDTLEAVGPATHQTVGSVLGLGSALQKAQDAANPGVYEILGSVINDAKTKFADFASTGLQVVHMFDEFAARVTVDLRTGMGDQVRGLLDGMVTSLRQFGEVLGNLGHALLNFASTMPGLAHFLLATAEGLSSVIEWASRGGALITFAIGMEELYRWGGLVVGILNRLTGGMATMNAIAGDGGFIIRFAAGLQALVGRAGMLVSAFGGGIAELGLFGGAAGRAGAALQGLGQEMTAVTYLSPALVAGWVGAGAALVGLVLMLARVKNSTQDWIASTNQAIQSATALQVVSKLGAAFADVTTRIGQQEAALRSYSGVSQGVGTALGGVVMNLSRLPGPLGNAAQGFFNLSTSTGHWGDSVRSLIGLVPGLGIVWSKLGIGGAEQAASNISRLRVEEASLVGTTSTFSNNLSYLGGQFHTTAAGALALANAAGVNLTQGLLKGTLQGQIALQMINNLKTGLGAMQAPAGQIGADMNAIGIQSQLAATKVGNVNQSLDAFVAQTTTGMNQVMQFNAQLQQMGKDGLSSSVSITGAINSISRSAAKMGYTLQGIGPHAQQSWQQFDAAVQQGNSILDTFRTGMAEGVVSQQQYASEIRAVGGALLPFAAHSRTALAIVSQLAQQMGAPATTNLKTLAAQFGVTGRQAQNMATTGMLRAVAAMSNLNQVARNLSVTVGTQLDAAMSRAIVSQSGLTGAYNKWATDLRNNAGATALQKDLTAIRNDQNFVSSATQKATTMMNSNAAATAKAATGYKDAASAAGDATSKITAHIAATDKAAGASSVMASKVAMLSQNLQNNASDASRAGSATQQAASQVQHLGSVATTTQAHVGNVNNEIRTMTGAAGAAGGPVNALAASIARAGAEAAAATAQVRGLEAAIASLQSKTITVTTNMVTVSSTVHRQHGGPVLAGMPYMTGEAGRELFVPASNGYVFSNPDTERFMGSPGGGHAGTVRVGVGGGPAQATIHNHVFLDGQQIWNGVRTETLRWNTRNGNPQSGAMGRAVAPGG
jgi:hypothetical protein